MLDTMGPELQVFNENGNPIELIVDANVVITPDLSKVPSAEVLPVNYSGLAKVCLLVVTLVQKLWVAYFMTKIMVFLLKIFSNVFMPRNITSDFQIQ